ncbi:MAG: FAD binding domain-containing protein [Acidimicrobiia bacterium]|jgi:CO/xanthine dehydrogenase FAD-binding subunit
MDMVRPGSIEAALEALSDHAGAAILSGGTDLMVQVNQAHIRPEAVVSVRRVDELRRWEPGFVGAGVTYARLEMEAHGALAELARAVGSPQIRAWGTIGGNLGTASPAGDSLPWLAALDADVVLASLEGIRRLRWDKFLLGPKQTGIRPGELILGVEVPADPPERQAFAKVGVRQAMVISIASCCVMRSDDGTTRVALGSVGPTVLRAQRAEQMISPIAQPSSADLAEFSRLVEEEVRPITDHRATAEYRRHAAGVIARRCLERVL